MFLQEAVRLAKQAAVEPLEQPKQEPEALEPSMAMSPRAILGRLIARAQAWSDYCLEATGLMKTRWYLLLRTIPSVAVALALRFFLGEVLGLRFFSSALVNGFSQSAIFVLAILISGVLEDYKESEGLPASMASDVEGLSEQVELAVLVNAARRESGDGGSAALPSGIALHTEVLQMLESVFAFLAGVITDREALSSISSHSRFLATSLSIAGFEDQASAIMEFAHQLRSTLNRMYVIKRTDFLESGTALMELLVYITLGLCILGKPEEGESLVEGFSGVAFNTLQFCYVIELLRDIDDPFEYQVSHLMPILVEGEVCMPGAGVSAEVDLFPLMNVYARMAQRAGLVVGKTDRSQDLAIVRGSGKLIRRASAAVSPREVAEEQPASGKSGGAQDGLKEREEDDKEDDKGDEKVDEPAFVKALREKMEAVWGEADCIEPSAQDLSSSLFVDALEGELGGGGEEVACAAAQQCPTESKPANAEASSAPDGDGLRQRRVVVSLSKGEVSFVVGDAVPSSLKAFVPSSPQRYAGGSFVQRNNGRSSAE